MPRVTMTGRRLSGTLVLLSMIALVTIAATPTALAATSSRTARLGHGNAVVPVLSEAGGVVLRERQRGARVRVYAVARHRRRLVGRARTGSAGVALVRLRQRHAPKRMLVVVGGGRMLGRRFGGRMKSLVEYRGHQAVFVSPISSLVTRYRGEHRLDKLKAAKQKVRRSLGIPGFYDFASDLADRSLFNGAAFVRQGRAHGGFDRFVRRRSRRLGRHPASSSAVANESCWDEAARTTAGFAEVMGFREVPSPPSLPACRLGGTAAGASATASAEAKASAIPGLEVFGVLTSVASLIYGVASGQSTSAQLAELHAQLNEVQAELQEIQADLGGLQTEVAGVNANVVASAESTLISDAVPTITAIKVDSAEVTALLGAASQILCEPGEGCSVPAGSADLGSALDSACDVETKACEKFYEALYFTSRALEGERPAKAIENLGTYAGGSAIAGAGNAGIIQFALEQGAGDEPFFTTASAADARLQWAYYSLYSAYAQTMYATVLGMGIGQPLPNAHSSHPPKLSISTMREQVDALNKPIGQQIALFPNMPDTAVIVTNAESEKEPPYMLPQQVGGVASASAYVVKAEYALDQADVSAGVITSNGSAHLGTLQSSGKPPLVMTPAAATGETWELLPSGGKRSRPPTISTATFSDWVPAGATNPGSTLPEWNSSTEKVEASKTPLAGALPDLYGEAKPAAGETAGQWMTSHSGIESTLLTPAGTGYGSAPSGVFTYYQESGADSKEPGLAFGSCVPGGDEECLLPTWQSTSINPYSQVTSGHSYNTGSSQINTGLFDFNTGLVIANQQGHKKDEAEGFQKEYASNPGAFLNQYANWSSYQELRGEPFDGLLEALDGVSSDTLENASFNSAGRPILFEREQQSNDCFYWTSSGSGPAYGSGCLKPRVHSGEVLP